jgi:hypothetical protein
VDHGVSALHGAIDRDRIPHVTPDQFNLPQRGVREAVCVDLVNQAVQDSYVDAPGQ